MAQAPDLTLLWTEVLRNQHEGRDRAAADLCAIILRAVPDEPAVLGKSGNLLCRLGDTARGLDALHRVVTLRPRDLDDCIALAAALFDARQYRRAIWASEEALVVDPRSVSALRLRGEAELHLGRLAEAAAGFALAPHRTGARRPASPACAGAASARAARRGGRGVRQGTRPSSRPRNMVQSRRRVMAAVAFRRRGGKHSGGVAAVSAPGRAAVRAGAMAACGGAACRCGVGLPAGIGHRSALCPRAAWALHRATVAGRPDRGGDRCGAPIVCGASAAAGRRF